MSVLDHTMAGRLCGGYDVPTKEFTTIVVCSCGHSFIGLGIGQADDRWADHARAQADAPANRPVKLESE